VVAHQDIAISFVYIDNLSDEYSSKYRGVKDSTRQSPNKVIRGVASKLFRFKVFSGFEKKDNFAENSAIPLDNVAYEVIIELDDGKSSKKLTALVASNLAAEFIRKCNQYRGNDHSPIAFFREFHGIFHFQYLEEYLAPDNCASLSDESIFGRYNITVVLTHFASDSELQQLLKSFEG
jgi:hypothetical protein